MRGLSLGAALVLLAGCAAGSQSSGRSSFTLTPEDWSGLAATNALEAIVLLRPTWVGGRTDIEDDRADNCVEVFENQRNVGSRSALARYALDEIQSIRYIPKGNPRPGDPFASMQQCIGIQVRT